MGNDRLIDLQTLDRQIACTHMALTAEVSIWPGMIHE